ncbi:MAG: acetoin utilization AcuB family protein [Desulfobulbaceae bacterium]
MYVHYYMTREPLTISPETRVGEAEKLLATRGFRHLPVVDGEGRLAGMVTDRDLRSALPSSLKGGDDREAELSRVREQPVSDIMSTRTMVLRTVSTLDDAMLFFEKRSVGALPVLDAEDRVVGILSFTDLMKAWKSLFGLGEKGAFIIGLEADPDRSLTPLVQALEEAGVPFSRLVRTDGSGREPAMIYLRVQTYNVRSVHAAIGKAGFRVHQPGEAMET